MAKARRDAKGRFVKASRARTPRKTTTRKTAARKRTYRRNPRKRPDLFGMFTQGTMTAAQVLVGKAAARSVPEIANLPKEGNTGLAIQVLVAIAMGYISDQFLSRDAAAAILAGGLTAPLETFVVSQRVPWFSEALSPTTLEAEVGAYMGRYPTRPALVAGYPGTGRYPPSLGRYSSANDPEAMEPDAYGHGII